MPSNLLIFDAEYVSELTSRMNQACELMYEAVSSLKSASAHENWKCKERTKILDDFEELNVKLGRLDNGVNETTRILGGSVSRFAALESQYESQAEFLSDDLTQNHGYTAAVAIDVVDIGEPNNQPSPGDSASPSGAAASDSGAGADAGSAVGAAGAAGAGAAGHHAGSGGHGASAAAMAGRMAGRGIQHNHEHNTGTGPEASGGGTMTINLPVTHIPDSPDAAARGIKDTKAVAEAAVTITVRAITTAFNDGNMQVANFLAEAYDTGRSIFENSSAIMNTPAQSHTTERLAMAAGLMSLAGSSAAGIAVLGQVSASAASSSSHSSESFSRNAKNFLASAQGNSGSSELSKVLGAITGNDSVSVSSSGSGKESFFDMIVNALKKAISGEEASSSESTPVTEFLGSFVR